MGSITHKFHAMGGPNELVVLDSSETAARAIAAEMEGEVRRIERALSRYVSDGIVARINAGAGRSESVAVDEECAKLIDFASMLHVQSGGCFDLTSGVLRRVWSFRPPIRVPREEEISSVLSLIGWDRVEWDGHSIRLPEEGMEIDLGGIGKEYAVDRLAGIAFDRGARAMINCAGDLRVTGAKAQEQPWRIGVQHPREHGGVVAVVNLVEGSVATSGDYQRFIEVGGRRYSHLLDPRTGWPVESFQSVSVVAQSCMIAGSAATVAMLRGEGDGLAFLDELGLSYLVVTQDGTVKRGGGDSQSESPFLTA